MLIAEFEKQKNFIGEEIVQSLSGGVDQAVRDADYFLKHKRKELHHMHHITVGLAAALYALPAIFEKDALAGSRLFEKAIAFSGVETGRIKYAGGRCRHNEEAFLLVSFPQYEGDIFRYASTGMHGSREIIFYAPDSSVFSFMAGREGEEHPVFDISEEFRRYARNELKPGVMRRVKNLLRKMIGKNQPDKFFDVDVLLKIITAKTPMTAEELLCRRARIYHFPQQRRLQP